MRAGFRVAEKCADALIQFGADDVLEFAGLVMRFRIVDGERVFEQPLGQAMSAHHIAGAAAARICELHIAFAHIPRASDRTMRPSVRT